MQRVSHASVRVADELVGATANGLLVLLGVGPRDDERVADKLAAKVRKLRIFEDEGGRMNRSLQDVGGACLVVSQFTLYGDARSGNRPGFSNAAAPEAADRLYRRFVAALEREGIEVATGRFGEEMQVELLNRGPVTLWLDSDELFGSS